MLPFAMSIDVRKHTDAFGSLVVFIFVVVFGRVASGVRNYSSTKKKQYNLKYMKAKICPTLKYTVYVLQSAGDTFVQIQLGNKKETNSIFSQREFGDF